MVVDATKERRRRILSDHLYQMVGPARVFLDEVAHVVDEAGNENKGSLLGLLLDYSRGSGKNNDYKLGKNVVLTTLPTNHGKVIAVTRPL